MFMPLEAKTAICYHVPMVYENLLITGGAGYIGSHVAKCLIERKVGAITIVDNLSTGFEATVNTLESMAKEKGIEFEFVKMDLSDTTTLRRLFEGKGFSAVMHFAASIVVPESVKDPIKYYQNNTVNSISLIEFSLRYKVKGFIFSSTAVVYGIPSKTPIKEDNNTCPINPYGWSKLMTERVLADASFAYPDFGVVLLRYFNVAGADVKLRMGQSTPNATHLIKVAAQTALGIRDRLFIFGNDYDTPDGTCIRDYIHVDDLADAHLEMLDQLKPGVCEVFNCGYGHGYSVLEVIEAMKRVSGVDFPVEFANRRAGDAPVLVADNRKILSKTRWRPKYDDLDFICETALKWERKLTSGNS